MHWAIRIVLSAGLLSTGCIAAPFSGGEAAPRAGEVAFELVGPGGAALVVPVHVNGAGPFPFVLDTGATVTCVDDALASELQLPDAAGTVAIGAGVAGMGRIRVVSLESIALGDAIVRDLRGCALDLGSVQKVGVDVKGLLGLNFLQSYRMTIDFPARTVRLEPPSATPPATGPSD